MVQLLSSGAKDLNFVYSLYEGAVRLAKLFVFWDKHTLLVTTNQCKIIHLMNDNVIVSLS